MQIREIALIIYAGGWLCFAGIVYLLEIYVFHPRRIREENKEQINELHSARIMFKGWDIEKQTKFYKQISEEFAYYCGVNNIPWNDFNKEAKINYKQGLEHYKNGL